MSQDDQKTEEATPFKLNEARKKGQVAKSADLVAFAGLFFCMIFMAYFLPYFFKKIMRLFFDIYSTDFFHINNRFLLIALKDCIDLVLFLSLPILFCAMLAGILANIAQFGLLFTVYPLRFDLKKINPIHGIKKIFSKEKLLEFIKQMLKFSVVFLVIFYTIKSFIKEVILLFRLSLINAINIIVNLLYLVIFRVLVCFLIIAIFDFFWQRHSFLKSMKMSKYEIKKEYKQQEGDPQIKQERRRIVEEAMNEEAVLNIENASVLLTNPAHLAVAIKYEQEKNEAPRVIAKGVGKQALVLIKKATSAKVPVIRNVPLARDLQWLEIDEEIPEHLYDSVAEVLTFIAELNKRHTKGA